MSSSLGKIFCIGIGGIGLSALARFYAHQGYEVCGSDLSESDLTQKLRSEGIEVFIGHDALHIADDVTEVIYTIAVNKKTNVEFVSAKELSLPMLSYPEALGRVTKEKKTIAVCGTHGKTTTTAMAYYALKKAGINPTIIVGSLIGGVGSNFIAGDSEYLLVEACEYRRSFLNLHPTYILLTNIDNDHLDYYQDEADILSAFQSFVDKVPEGGKVLLHDAEFEKIVSDKKVRVDTTSSENIDLIVFGKHNRTNASLVVTLGAELLLSDEKIREGLLEFPGTWRRLEYRGDAMGALWYDDYGHHPTEVMATLSALREKYAQGEQKLIVIFQPHLYSRTKLFINEFAESFTLADQVLLLPIYAAREEKDETISSEMLAEKIGEKACFFETKEEIVNYLKESDITGRVILTLGAGDVNLIHNIISS